MTSLPGPERAAFWARAQAALPGQLPEHPQEPWFFGNEELADALLALVLVGKKTATSSYLGAYDDSGEPLPAVGDIDIITDATGVPRAVIRTTEVLVTTFGGVGEEFAAAEGEGDHTLAFWRAAHRQFFETTYGITVTPDLPVVCERFELLYAEQPE